MEDQQAATYVAAIRFNRYRMGQQVFETGAKLQQLIRRGVVKEIKVVVPPEVKAEPPQEVKAEAASVSTPKRKYAKRKPKAAA